MLQREIGASAARFLERKGRERRPGLVRWRRRAFRLSTARTIAANFRTVMRILFIHQNFPGQFIHVAHALKREGRHELLAVTHEGNERERLIPTRTYGFTPKPLKAAPFVDHYAQRVARGLAVADLLVTLRREGFAPDLVIGHGGWGETLFVKDVWPRTKIILHAEFYYDPDESDVGFDREFGPDPDADIAVRFRVRTRNMAMLQALSDADLGVAPTRWQASRFPKHLQGKIAIVHEGIDTDRARPDPGASVKLNRDGVSLRPGDEVVTFVNRNFEPYRGYHIFMRALPEILERRPNARVLLVGGNGVNYGAAPPNGESWRKIFFDEVRGRLDVGRIHFVGKLTHPNYLRVLQISAAHAYLTYPFVLSWSMLEAMSAGALVIGSATPPVEEVIAHGRNGLLFPFFEPATLAERVIGALADLNAHAPLRQAARRTILDHYDLRRNCLPRWLQLIETVVR
jgi:glycosyltransferase involved in cell wall biosynthesis